MNQIFSSIIELMRYVIPLRGVAFARKFRRDSGCKRGSIPSVRTNAMRFVNPTRFIAPGVDAIALIFSMLSYWPRPETDARGVVVDYQPQVGGSG
jgi:hypothetical protein